ncbi:heterokaryon incompatibility protein-domain-containing protein [Podospora didyma]|uniref:Heterokaryon incompatibility protein-domain-containing protein n=1 Tax=Podospora didyma TaxID=330526 RepID=A0AAE0P8E6_9PEZI|nr:heterokaryon incompatibility protein-domain-containing protein [Podospora didyma]
MPKAGTYKYNQSRVYAVQRASREAQEKRSKDEPAPDPPLSNASYGKVIMRSVGREKLPTVPHPRTKARYSNICPSCEGVMVGSGTPTKVVDEDGQQRDELYWHLHRVAMRTNASAGCSLCRTLLGELRQRMPDSDVGDPAQNFAGYDFGSFTNPGSRDVSDRTYVLLFQEFTENGRNKVVLNLQNLTGPAAVATARIWLRDCTEEHTCTQAAQASRFLPLRLIDVGKWGEGENDKDDDIIRLIAAQDIDPGHPYLTLSHCWGNVDAHGAYTLTTARVETYHAQIPQDILPKTFLQACHLTRGLQQRYLWIDSLCIIQDSPADWAEQSTQMWQIYSNSFLNISATASRGPGEGLFRQRRDENAPGVCMLNIEENHPALPTGDYRLYSDGLWSRGVDGGPVNGRAWVLQERLLAPRILHFGEREVFWECHQLKAAESFPMGVLPLMDCKSPISIRDSEEKKTPFISSSGAEVPHYALLKAWSAIVESYSALSLSFQSDKLVALSALAEQVSLAYPSGGRYLAGLWEAPLVAQLLWKSLGDGGARTDNDKLSYRAPSWSWACIDGSVDPNFDFSGYEPYGSNSVSRPMLKILDVTINSKSKSHTYGAVESGCSLRVAGCLLRARFQKPATRPQREQQTVADRKKGWIDMMARMSIPGYTGEALDIMSNLTLGKENSWVDKETLIGTDVQNGVLFLGDDDQDFEWWGPTVVFSRRDTGSRSGFGSGSDITEVKLPVMFDRRVEEEDEMEPGRELFVLPVSCVTANDRRYNREGDEISSLGCLLLAVCEKPDGKRLKYRRVGMCHVSDDQATGFLCELGNQQEEGEEDRDGGGEETSAAAHRRGGLPLQDDPLKLEDFIPQAWPSKELEFVPRKFARFDITIV